MSRSPARLALAALALLAPVAARGQISPGPLTRAHAKLEGSTRCLDCHDPREGVSASKCLVCHEPLAKRVAAGKGLHAREGYRECHRCHIEHQGADFALVHWGKQGQSAFDHAQTGHALHGRHAALACAECHKTRSFLGQVAECSGCHRDQHRGEFAGRACGACHGEQAWKPAPGFDHAKTSWPLAGRHAAVACERCHPAGRVDPRAAQAYRLFRVAAQGRECSSCHADPHKSRLGTACASCHSPAGWKQTRIVASSFDHSRTGYPLSGRHAGVACESCHKPGRPMRLPHERCGDCHEDVHGGTLTQRADAGRCESCHGVEGFRPARFGPEDHAETAYALRGAHLAIACDECHRSGPSATGVRRVAVAASSVRVPLKLGATRCADCHGDPHRGEPATVSAQGGCETCHRVEAWRDVAFDHAKTRYPLSGQHARVACQRCHARAETRAGAPPAPLHFKGAATECASCHKDPHGGQFAASGRTACERCHATDSLRASLFVHDRDARYRLDGAHSRLACAACHKPEPRGASRVVHYKPLPLTCNGCHGAEKVASNGGPR